jgi:CRP-like cAMP-binding protein
MAALSLAPRTATVTAATPMVVIVIGESDLDAFLSEHPVAVQMLRTALARLRILEAQFT